MNGLDLKYVIDTINRSEIVKINCDDKMVKSINNLVCTLASCKDTDIEYNVSYEDLKNELNKDNNVRECRQHLFSLFAYVHQTTLSADSQIRDGLCPFCLETLAVINVISTDCGIYIHDWCYDTWYTQNNECILCRKDRNDGQC